MARLPHVFVFMICAVALNKVLVVSIKDDISLFTECENTDLSDYMVHK
jgi:hypothetical protein